MIEYVVTEGSIIVPGKPRRRLLKRGFTFSDADPIAVQLGVKEVGRLVTQGWLKIKGLRAGLERGSIIPQHKPLPTTVKFDDPQGNKVAEVEHGRGKVEQRLVKADLARTASPPSVDEGDNEIELPGADVPAPGTPRGKWLVDPATLAEKPIDVLNAMLADVDADAPQFEAGEEEDARRFLSQDFAAQAAARAADEQAKTVVTGDALPHGKGGKGKAARSVRANRG